MFAGRERPGFAFGRTTGQAPATSHYVAGIHGDRPPSGALQAPGGISAERGESSSG